MRDGRGHGFGRRLAELTLPGGCVQSKWSPSRYDDGAPHSHFRGLERDPLEVTGSHCPAASGQLLAGTELGRIERFGVAAAGRRHETGNAHDPRELHATD